MQTIITPTVVFTPAARTLDFTALAGFDVRRLIRVVNVTRGVVLYQPADWANGLNTIANPVITLDYDTTSMLAGDLLQIVYDDGSGSGASGATPSGSGSAFSGNANFTPTAAAYGAGDLLDVAKDFALGVTSGSLVRVLTAVVKIDVASVPAGQTSFTLQLYAVTPPSAQADNATWTLASADLASYLGSISLGTPVDLGNALYVKTQGVDFDMRLSGTSIFGQLITAGAHTATAVARSVQLMGVVL